MRSWPEPKPRDRCSTIWVNRHLRSPFLKPSGLFSDPRYLSLSFCTSVNPETASGVLSLCLVRRYSGAIPLSRTALAKEYKDFCWTVIAVAQILQYFQELRRGSWSEPHLYWLLTREVGSLPEGADFELRMSPGNSCLSLWLRTRKVNSHGGQ